MRKSSGGATKAVVGVADCIAHLTMRVLVIGISVQKTVKLLWVAYLSSFSVKCLLF